MRSDVERRGLREKERRLACLFDLLLTRYAVSRPRYGFQSFGIDLTPAGKAEAKAAIVDPLERFFHHLKQMPFVCALPKKKVLCVRACRAVYVTRAKPTEMVLVETESQKILISPDHPGRFLDAAGFSKPASGPSSGHRPNPTASGPGPHASGLSKNRN